MKKSITLRYLVGSAMLGAVAFVLMFFDFSIPIMPSFIKMDFSDLPELIGAFAYGPFYGVLIAFIKNGLHLFRTSTMAIGELSNFLLGSVFALVAGLIYKKNRTFKGAIIGSIAGAFAMGIFSLLSNYVLIYPLYYNVLGFPEVAILGMYKAILPSTPNIFMALLIFNVPFTIVKGLFSVIITLLIYKPLRPVLKMTFLDKKKDK